MDSNIFGSTLTAYLKNYLKTYVSLSYRYSETSLERPLPRETTCLERPHITGKDNILLQLNLLPETTCLERPHFCGQGGGLSKQVLLYY